MRRMLVIGLSVGLVLTGTSSTAGAAESSRPQSFIVVLEDGEDPRTVAREHAMEHAASPHALYQYALRGYAVRMSPAAAQRLTDDPRVAYVEADTVAYALHHRNGHDGGPSESEPASSSQTLPTGVDRIDADAHPLVNVDGVDEAIDVDIAVLDTGADEDHPDLRFGGGWNCVSYLGFECVEGQYEDGHGHGTHVSGTIGAIDNGYGVVGMAPGARIWPVGVLDDNGGGYWSWIIKGIDKVAEHADQIEVANMSLGGTGYLQSAHDAIKNAVDLGVVFTVAAGNSTVDVYGDDGVFGTSDDFFPASIPEVATISALADADGAAGGNGGNTSYGSDDSFATFSSFSAFVDAANPVTSPGRAIDLLMPGVDIYSTDRWGGYTTMSGTSMAAPHAAGLFALHIAQHGRDADGDGIHDGADVAALRQTLIDGGVAQSDPARGLALTNDPDGYEEPIGWAGDSTQATNGAPVAEAGGPYTTEPEVTVTLDASGSSDPDADSLTYSWDFGDGSSTPFSSDATADHAYATAGTYTATVTVSDGSLTSTDSAAVTVSDTSGFAVTGISPDTIAAGDVVSVTVSGSGFVAGSTLSLANGSGPSPSASSEAVSDGGSTLTATVTDKGGGPPRNRTWDVVVTRPDGSQAVLAGGFTVTVA